MKDENYIVIQGWMMNKLNLSGNSLLIYAIIYGFSQDGNSCFQGTPAYLSKSLNISRQSVYNILDKLLKDGLILKMEKEVNTLKLTDYKVNLEILHSVKKFDNDVKKFDRGCQKILHHNNIDNNIDNKDIANKEVCDTQVKKPKPKTALQEFSNEVIKRFENLEAHQIPIWFRRNCRCLTDILKFCGGRKEDIPMALECISVCCDIMSKKGFNAGYEAVCRNLSYYYEEAKKRLGGRK